MSNRIEVCSIIRVYEVDGQEVGWASKDEPVPHVFVRSHKIRANMVCLSVDTEDGTVCHEYTVVASDLEAAIKNARNAG